MLAESRSRSSRSGSTVTTRVLDDLRERLARTRFPNQVAGAGWDQGTELGYLQELVGVLARRVRLARRRGPAATRSTSYVTEVDGQRIHFARTRARPSPTRCRCSSVHGWPGLGRRVPRRARAAHRPVAHGGDPADAFHVVAPSLPGLRVLRPDARAPGWHPRRIAGGVRRAHGRRSATTATARRAATGARSCRRTSPTSTPRTCVGLHLNFVVTARRPKEIAPLTPEEQAALAGLQRVAPHGRGLPGDPGHEAADARLRARGLAGRARGVDRREVPGVVRLRRRRRAQLHQGPAARRTSRSTGSPGRSRRRRRLYYEMRQAGRGSIPQELRRACRPASRTSRARSRRCPRRGSKRRYNVTHWTEQPRGGHFAAMEVPDLFVDDVRTFFRTCADADSRADR